MQALFESYFQNQIDIPEKLRLLYQEQRNVSCASRMK